MTTVDLNAIIPEEAQTKITEMAINTLLRKHVSGLHSLLNTQDGQSTNQWSEVVEWLESIENTLSNIKKSEIGSVLAIDRNMIKSIIKYMAKNYIDKEHKEHDIIVSVYDAMADSIIKHYLKGQNIAKKNEESPEKAIVEEVLHPFHGATLYWKLIIKEMVEKTISDYTQTIDPTQLEDFVAAIINDFREQNKLAIDSFSKALLLLRQEINNEKSAIAEHKGKLIMIEAKREYPDGQWRKENATV